MARVKRFLPSTQTIGVHPTEVDCEYQVLSDGASTWLHLSTFGSHARQGGRKSSQSIQLDFERAQELVGIIARAFPEIRRS